MVRQTIIEMSDSKPNFIKVDVADLKIGMYVDELDIPWLESPFLFQGFPLNNEGKIEEVASRGVNVMSAKELVK